MSVAQAEVTSNTLVRFEDLSDLYLGRCQVDTPAAIVDLVWDLIGDRRDQFGDVVDFGAGDGRFCPRGRYSSYRGYEIDPNRTSGVELGENSQLITACAFESEHFNADICVGNPPYVRNQDLPDGWRARAADILSKSTNVRVSGLANAWQYFFLLSLCSVNNRGLVALVIPTEWVTRPSARSLRDYVRKNNWDVDIYRLPDSTFDGVLTTASITVIDKRSVEGKWRYFDIGPDGPRVLGSPTGNDLEAIGYTRPSKAGARVSRGLSPGSQDTLVLTEASRARLGLRVMTDVYPCVTSLKPIPEDLRVLDEGAFNRYYRDAGVKCWLVASDSEPSTQLRAYLEAVPDAARQTATCQAREIWWQFSMPAIPGALVAQTFKDGATPKRVRNAVDARAVGGVAGLFDADSGQVGAFLAAFDSPDVGAATMAYAKGLRKLEIGQLNTVIHLLPGFRDD